MKATGIVRRIDDLGRVVIPKEIRRTMHIREGDPLEIYTTRDGEVIFKKYSLIRGLEDFAEELCDALNHTTGLTAAISDRDTLLAVAGSGKRELLGKPLSPAMDQLLEQRSPYCRRSADTPLYGTENTLTSAVDVAVPVLCQGDVLGSVLLFSTDGRTCGDPECQLSQMAAAFLGRHLEN